MRLRFVLTVLVVGLAGAHSAFAQGCALCYTTASETGAAGQRALGWGILALLVPALMLFLAVFFLLFRRALSPSA